MHFHLKAFILCSFVFTITGRLTLPVIAETGEKLSSVEIISDSENTENTDSSRRWQKKTLSDYDDFSLISYQTVEISENREAVLVSDNSREDIVISNDPTPSAVNVEDVPAGSFAFTTYGWGHCVGMSQNGANFYAIYGGWNYQDILFHYYPGTVLKNTETAETEMITVQGIPGNALQQVAEIVNREVGPSFSTEAIKAQAVAVYTYIKYYNNDAHDLKGKPNPAQNIIDACASVLGEALYYNDTFAMTMFGASCGDLTADSNDIFSMNMPYLRSVSSDYDSQYDPHYGEVKYFTTEEVRNIIQNAYHITLSDNPENWIQIIEGNGGYAKQVIIDGQMTIRGDAFRYEFELKSPKFTYVYASPDIPEEVA
ncbi:MAG: hypothetical protein IJ644_04850, partial [Oscillospiraceae bacterium]|nr:hypothetical protein [Oscillospiraceae bacterium]